ncbi:hypothetical protein ABW21_db0202527 [Orbilia brochopaga]|nr:hypothetical protein ABW21_db0202527 [Drechslerella brochopaga]
MSGKSTFIRQVALMTIMAQIGSFVPAEYAAFPVVDRLFARVSMDDGVEANVSTFAAEMRETAFILQNATAGSIVIIDELGRGTCTRDGLAIAIAVCEALIERKMRAEKNVTSMLYKVSEGPATEQHYGINLARIVGLPPGIIQRASEVSTAIAQNAEQRKASSKGYIKAQRSKLIFQLVEHLAQARRSNMTDLALRKWLARLQEDFAYRMSQLNTANDDEDDDSTNEEDEDETSDAMVTNTMTDPTTDTTTADETYEDGSADIEMPMWRQETPILITSDGSPEQNTTSTSEQSSARRSGSYMTESGSGSNSYYSVSHSTMEDSRSTRNELTMTSVTYLSSLDLQDIEELSDVEDQI